MTEELEVIDHTTQELSKFDRIEAEIALIERTARAIVVSDYMDKANATKARNLRLTIKPTRIQADNLRKEIKAPFLKLCDVIEKKGQSIIKPLDAIERELKAKEEIVSKHAEREAQKVRERDAAELAEARRKLAILEAEKTEREQREAKEKAEQEAKRQHEADIAAAVELGKQRAIAEQDMPLRASGIPFGQPIPEAEPARRSDREMLSGFAMLIANLPMPPVSGSKAYDLALEVGHRLREVAAFIERESANL